MKEDENELVKPTEKRENEANEWLVLVIACDVNIVDEEDIKLNCTKSCQRWREKGNREREKEIERKQENAIFSCKQTQRKVTFNSKRYDKMTNFNLTL